MKETTSLKEILKILKKRLLLIISSTIVAVSIAVVISFYILTPIYQAQTQILVNQKSTSEEVYSKAIMEVDIELINTYNDIITSPVILSKVIEDLQLDTTPEKLSYYIELSSGINSRVLYLKVLDSDPKLAVDIANTTVEIFKEEIPLLFNVDNINILSAATYSEDSIPVSPNKVRNIAIGAVIGLILGIGLAVLLEMLDTKIKDEKDVEEILDTPIMGVVGSIPLKKRKKSSTKTHKMRGNPNAWVEK